MPKPFITIGEDRAMMVEDAATLNAVCRIVESPIVQLHEGDEFRP
ncbi:hypothetical protein [Thiocapsa imhoffii]|nr:hypothetical protein [Thiocapsa imhoffii]